MPDDILTGSCLCGATAYQVKLPFLRFAHCHCSRCRKATGTSHATYLYFAPASFAWTTGSDCVVRFDLPAARSFATTFCQQCGSPLPHHTRNQREIVVPAGSLDSPLTMRPEANIFWDSRAPWGSSDDGIPCFSELPDWWWHKQ